MPTDWQITFSETFSKYRIRFLMPRSHMQIWQPGTKRKTYIKVFLCCQGHAIFSLWRG